MKKLYYIIPFFSAILFAASCRKYVEIGVPGKQVLTYTSDYQDLLNTSSNVEATMFYPELYSDDVDWLDSTYAVQVSTDQANAYSWSDNIVGDGNEDPDWAALYQTIYYTNQIISGVMSSENGTNAQKLNVQSQAYVTRALSYYYLVNSYAKQYNPQTSKTDLGVPLVLSTKLVGVKLDRKPVASVYDQMLSDLKISLPYLDKKPSYNNLASQQGAYGVLARVYLQMSQYDSAAKYADSALAINNFMDNLADYQNNISSYPGVYDDKEILFEKKLRYSTPTLPLSQSLLSLFDQQSDLRYILFTETGENYWPAFSGFAYSKFKYVIPYGTVNVGPTVPEMYLIKAEVAARNNDLPSSLKFINMIRQKRYTTSGYVDLSTTNQNECMNYVIAERRKELVGTAMRLFDLKRFNLESAYQTTVQHHYKNQLLTLQPNSNDYLLPIATKYIGLNPEIKQNER